MRRMPPPIAAVLLPVLMSVPVSLPLSLPFLALPACGLHAQPAAAALNAQDRADLSRIEAYLNGIHALNARFVQMAPDGQSSEGQVWLQRPGRMRFQYDPPSPLLLVAGHGLVVFHDSSLGQTSNIPVGSTPLGLLLAEHIQLSGDVTVTNITRLPGQIQVTMLRTAKPGDGTLTLVLADAPGSGLVLRSWRVVDAQRQETRVSLLNVKLGGDFDQSLFTFIDPNFFGNATQ